MKKLLALLSVLILFGCSNSKICFNDLYEQYFVNTNLETIADKQLILNKTDNVDVSYQLIDSPDIARPDAIVKVIVTIDNREISQCFNHIYYYDDNPPIIETKAFPYYLQNSIIYPKDIVDVYDMLYEGKKLIYPKANYFALFNLENSLDQNWSLAYKPEYLEDISNQNSNHVLGYTIRNNQGNLVGNYQSYDIENNYGNDAYFGNKYDRIDTSNLGKQQFIVSAIDQNGNLNEKQIEIEIVDEATYNKLKGK